MGNLNKAASATIHDLKTDQHHFGAASIKAELGASYSGKTLLHLSGRPMVFNRGRCLSMLTVSWLHALEDLAQLVSNLPELTVDLLTEVLVLLFQAADLLLQPVYAL